MYFMTLKAVLIVKDLYIPLTFPTQKFLDEHCFYKSYDNIRSFLLNICFFEDGGGGEKDRQMGIN